MTSQHPQDCPTCKSLENDAEGLLDHWFGAAPHIPLELTPHLKRAPKRERSNATLSTEP